jgi:hypothetical protein
MSGGYRFTLARRAGFIRTPSGVPTEFLTVFPAGALFMLHIPPPALVRAGLESLPAIIRAQGERAGRRFIEFFTATIRASSPSSVRVLRAPAPPPLTASRRSGWKCD